MTEEDITEELTRITDDLHAIVFSLKILGREFGQRSSTSDVAPGQQR